jgi:flavin-binding protein dodecin
VHKKIHRELSTLKRAPLLLFLNRKRADLEVKMSEHIYKQIELTGTSKTSVEDAVQNAVTKAGQTLHNIHWFQVIETRGYIENNKIDYWQVVIKLGFRLDD